MTNLDTLRRILNHNDLSEKWNYSYGITETRSNALILDSSHQDSFFNPKPKSAETTLTLFMLGNIDMWKQDGSLKNSLPRYPKNSSWNKTFFKKVRMDDDLFQKNGVNPLWGELINCDTNNVDVDFEKSILLFEFEIMNNAFHPVEYGSFKDLSFIDITPNPKWSRFDAVLIFPTNKFFVFIETKLAGYDDNKTKANDNKPNQVLRNLESAYLLTKNPKSLYFGWNFVYLFISPEEFNGKNEYFTMLDNAPIYYQDLLNNMKKSANYDKFFSSFRNNISSHIIIKNWNELGELLKKDDKNFFKNYLNNLRTLPEDITNEQIKVITNRLLTAGIKL